MQIQDEIRKGTITVFITKYSGIIIGLIINSVLARLLSPEEFGIVGVVTVFITFFNILSDIGIGVAIVQNQTLTNHDISSIFKISIFISIILGVAFYLVSYGIAEFYENKEYIRIGQLLSVTIFFSSVTVVPRSLLLKQQSFKIIGITEILISLITGLGAILLAFKDFSYYAIIWRSILSSVFLFILYFRLSKIVISSGLNYSGFKKIGKYSLNQFAFNFINYFSRNLDNILVGKYMGNASLGLYNQACQLMMYPIANLTHVITPVLHPILAKYQDNKKVIYDEYLKVVNILALLGVPISIFIYFSAKNIILLLLGDQWIMVVPILQILSFSIWIQMILSSSGAIFQAAGRTDYLFLSGLLSAVVMVLSISFGIVYFNSLIITCYLLVFSFSFNFVQCFYILINKLLGQSMLDLYKILLRQLLVALVMIPLLYLVTLYIDNTELPNIIILFLKFLSVIAIMGTFQQALIRKYYKVLIERNTLKTH